MCSVGIQMCVIEIHTMEREMLDFLGFSADLKNHKFARNHQKRLDLVLFVVGFGI